MIHFQYFPNDVFSSRNVPIKFFDLARLALNTSRLPVGQNKLMRNKSENSLKGFTGLSRNWNLNYHNDVNVEVVFFFFLSTASRPASPSHNTSESVMPRLSQFIPALHHALVKARANPPTELSAGVERQARDYFVGLKDGKVSTTFLFFCHGMWSSLDFLWCSFSSLNYPNAVDGHKGCSWCLNGKFKTNQPV